MSERISTNERRGPVEELRCELKITVSELGRQLGVSQGHAADLCTQRRPPSLPIAAALDRLAGEPRFLPAALARKMGGRAA